MMNRFSDYPLIRTLQKAHEESIPFWFMRQAGRYLPEYRKLRAQAKDFLDFCYTPDMAAEATWQPIARFGMSAAIIFSDILVVPHAMGVDVRFAEGHGPLLSPVTDLEALNALLPQKERLIPVYEALRNVRAKLDSKTALIGFAGAPWTLACYMVNGKGDRDYQNVRALALSNPAFFDTLIERLTHEVTQHLMAQVEAGAQVLQLFDSWAGVLSAEQFMRYAVNPAKIIVQTIRTRYPDIPLIGFPRLAGANYPVYANEVKPDGISIDPCVAPQWAAEHVRGVVLQGNLDPLLLVKGGEDMLSAAKRIVSSWGDKSFVFNLGHGILPHTPPDHVAILCDYIKGLHIRHG